MSEAVFSGSCLCGSVAYEITGQVLGFYHCHCERCRKATGTGHASNILLAPSGVTWTSGQSMLRTYKVPEAKVFKTQFCSNCGSLMPRFRDDMSVCVLPAGTLDHDPGLEPEARIFGGSRASWSCDARELPQFEEYPPRPG